MSSRKLHLLVVLSFASSASAVLAQEDSGDNQAAAPATDGLPQLQQVFSDDFRTDTRGDYEVKGDVAWERGKLTLAKGASISRRVNGGAWAKVRVQLAEAESTATVTPLELRIWFLLDGVTDCFVRWRQHPATEDGTTGSVTLADTVEKRGKLSGVLIREQRLAGNDISHLIIEYRHGLVTVSAAGQPMLIAHIANGNAVVTGCRVAAQRGSPELMDVSASLTTRPAELSTEQQQQLADAGDANRELFALYQQGDFAAAAERGEHVVRVKKSVLGEQHPDYAASLLNLGSLYNATGDYARAEPLLRQASDIWRSVLGERHLNYGASLNNLAALYEALGDYARAEPLYRQSLEINRSVLGEQHADFATSLNNLAVLYDTMGDPARAEPLYRQASDVWKSVLGEEHPDYGTSLNNLAAIYKRRGEYDLAEPLYRQAMEIYRSALGEQHPDYALSLHNLAGLYTSMSDAARAEPLYQKAVEIRRSVLGEQHPDYATSLTGLAVLYRSMGDFARTEPLFRQALRIRRSAFGDQHPDSAGALNNLAALYDDMADYARAEPLYRQALEIRRSLLGEQHPDYATSLNNLAALYEHMGDASRAEPLYRQALEIRKSVLGEQHPDYAASLNNLALLLRSMGDDNQAESLYTQAIAIDKSALGEQHPQYAVDLHNLASLYESTGEYARAAPLHATAVNVQRDSLDRNSVVQSERQQNRDQATKRLYLNSRLANALHFPQRSGAALEHLWQWKGAVTTRQQAYRQVAANPQLAPLFAELQSVSQQLSAWMGQTPTPADSPASDAAQAAYELKRSNWQDRFATLNRQREDLEQQIAAGSEEFRRIRKPLTVAAVQGWLPVGTAYVDFLEYQHGLPDAEQHGRTLYESRYLAFIVRSDVPPAVVGLGSATLAEETIAAFRQNFLSSEHTADHREAGEKAARQIRREVWLPIEEHLDGVHTVIISPDTALGTLPFAALPGQKDGSYLLEDYRLAMLPMAGLLPALFEDDSSDRVRSGLLVVGDVDYDAASGEPESAGDEQFYLADAGGLRGRQVHEWGSLAGFREELESVHALHRQHFGDNASAASLTGRFASERTFLQQAPQYGTLHVITHGYFEDLSVKSIEQADVLPEATLSSQTRGTDPFINTYLPGLLSGLVMAGANNPSQDSDDPRDGILRASEIEASSMQGVDLVVLSACETGLGAVAGGEGLSGLQRAFHVAGARSVVASLWKVDDRATQELMRRFYTNLWEHDMSRVNALREAQLWMLRHPKELEAMGVKGAATRGDVRPLKPADVKSPDSASGRTDPFFWAAFQLSGDWR